MGQTVGVTVIFCHQPTSCCLRRIHAWLYKQMDLPCQNYHWHWQPLKTIRGHDKAQIPACSYRQKCSEQQRTSPACTPACMHGWHWHHQPISTVSITLYHLKEYLSSCSNLPPTHPLFLLFYLFSYIIYTGNLHFALFSYLGNGTKDLGTEANNHR